MCEAVQHRWADISTGLGWLRPECQTVSKARFGLGTADRTAKTVLTKWSMCFSVQSPGKSAGSSSMERWRERGGVWLYSSSDCRLAVPCKKNSGKASSHLSCTFE